MEDKEQVAIERLKLAAEMSEAYYHKPALICYSGGKSTESSKQNSEAGGIAKKQTKKRKSRHARVMPKRRRYGLPSTSEVQMLPVCLTACTWQKNQAPPVFGDGAGGSSEK